ncbi:MAG TPA: UpxY family transcription antiterminator [Candidatus Angelobacter sp.]|jgi:transcription antitermination factor NusG|nr:UpxY family transcription antiterminator [Candidatus Angelobacter sp.]
MREDISKSPTSSRDLDAAKSWFAVFTMPRHEKRVEAHLCLREIENFLPLYQRQRQWKDGSKGVVQLPLFSNYVFVRIQHRGRILVLKVPGVISVVGCGAQPLPVPDLYIQWLREGLLERKIEPHPYLVAGTRVRIRSGIMSGMEGVLLRRKNNVRVVLTVEAIMRSMTVEVEIDDVEPVVRTWPASGGQDQEDPADRAFPHLKTLTRTVRAIA